MKDFGCRRGESEKNDVFFQKNTAHNECHLKINAYLCTRGGNSVADMT